MQQNTPPKMIVLQSAEGEHLGVVLLAIPDGADLGDCVFMILPPNTAIWDSPSVQPLFARKELGESKVRVISVTPLHLRIDSIGLPALVIQFSDSGAGMWSEEAPGTASGRAASPPPHNEPMPGPADL